MVRELSENGEHFYVCEECGLKYRDRETAGRCEAWCREHGSCNLEIIKYAVDLRDKLK